VNNDTAKPQSAVLLHAYEAAVLAFNVASATLILNLAAESLPSDEAIAEEERARAAVVAARREVWSLYRRNTR
jgi:hypothetical protein